MKPRIDIDITDCYGSRVNKILDVNSLEAYEICLNGSKVCIADQLNELELNNEKLKELLLRCWFVMLSEREALKSLESSLDSTYIDSTYINTLDTAIMGIKCDILNSGIVTNDELK